MKKELERIEEMKQALDAYDKAHKAVEATEDAIKVIYNKVKIANQDAYNAAKDAEDAYSAVDKVRAIVAEADDELEMQKCKNDPVYFYNKYVTIKKIKD